jgi:hypothetical protein
MGRRGLRTCFAAIVVAVTATSGAVARPLVLRQHPSISHLKAISGNRLIKVTATIKPHGLETMFHVWVHVQLETRELGSGSVSPGLPSKEIHASVAGTPSREEPYTITVEAENTAGAVSKTKTVVR